ncbi:MAG: helicase-related protein [Thermoplasmata archaeon]
MSPVWWNYATHCIKCNSENLGPETRRPIQFWTFDEVHSLHGLTGIYLSTFIALLQLYQRRATTPNDPPGGRIAKLFGFQVGTATIANEAELLAELTRLDDPNHQLIVSPADVEFSKSFEVDPSRTRYRSLVTMPIGTSSPRLATRTMVHVRDAILKNHKFQRQLETKLGYTGEGRPYGINLTYVQRKDVGRLLVREYRDATGRASGGGDTIPFISGDTPNDRLVDYFTRASKGSLQSFVANVVISLGLDIEDLNQLVMVSLPESITEFVQTIGRTGRRERAPGHAHVIVRPDLPRDIEFYANFHYILSDLRGYFEPRPMRRANRYAARQIFANVLRVVLFAHSTYDDRYMMTAPKAVQKLEANPALKVQVLRDLAEVLSGTEGPDYREYLDLAFDELTHLIVSWSSMGGPGNYIGGILSADQLLLLSLRDSEERDVSVRPVDALAGQLQQFHHEETVIEDDSADDTVEETGPP